MMEDPKSAAKLSVLDQIKQLMLELEAGKLKGPSHVEATIIKPESDETMEPGEGTPDEEKQDALEGEPKDDVAKVASLIAAKHSDPLASKSDEDTDPEMLAKLQELYAKLS